MKFEYSINGMYSVLIVALFMKSDVLFAFFLYHMNKGIIANDAKKNPTLVTNHIKCVCVYKKKKNERHIEEQTPETKNDGRHSVELQ